MPFLRREDIDPELRAKHDARYKRQMKEALLTPGLTASQREHLREQIRGVGQSKVYSADSSPKPGAISFQRT